MENSLKIIIVVVIFSLFGCASSQEPENELTRGCSRNIFATGPDVGYQSCIEQNQRFIDQRAYHARLQQDPAFAASEKRRLDLIELEKIEQEKKRIAFEKRKKNARNAGTSMEEFIFCYGEPEQRELMNGEDVFWYDDVTTPMFVVFKGKKLFSMFVDRKTLEMRVNNAQLAADRAIIERHHYDNIQQQQANRFQNALQFQQALSESRRPSKTTTNCRNTYNGVQCDSQTGTGW